jgi:hypothetical protein
MVLAKHKSKRLAKRETSMHVLTVRPAAQAMLRYAHHEEDRGA